MMTFSLRLPARATDYAVVLIDMQMSMPGGIEATRQIRALHDYRETPDPGLLFANLLEHRKSDPAVEARP